MHEVHGPRIAVSGRRVGGTRYKGEHHVGAVLTRAPLGVGGYVEPPVFLIICQTDTAINTKLSEPFGTSISHRMCNQKFRTYQVVRNDVRVTSCSGALDAK